MKTPASFRGHTGWRRSLGALAISTLALSGPLAAVVIPTSAAVASTSATEVVRTVTYNGRTITVRLHPIAVRGTKFEVLVQQADGSMVKQTNVRQSNAWLGSVDEDPAATASGIIGSDGKFTGNVDFDRGTTWRIRDTDVTGATTTVYDTRAFDYANPTYQWPSSTNAADNVSTSPGQAGTQTYSWDLGIDLSNKWFTNALIGSSIEKALDAVDLSVVTLDQLYISNTLTRPYIARVVVRADATKDPYAGGGTNLHKTRDEWQVNQADSGVDDVAQFNGSSGGGVAFVGTAGGSSGTASVGGYPVPFTVLRHELGHTWGPSDSHTGGPEGRTVMTGNQFDRFDGTELSSIFRYKNARLAKFAPEGVFDEPLPPYAALDLNDNQTSGNPLTYSPIANDHDANGGALTLASVETTSALGGTVTQNGNNVTYTPPVVTTDKAFDSFKYVVRDATGKTATGISMFRVTMPPVAPQTEGRAAGWAVHAITNGGTYTALGNGSGLFAAAPLDGTPGLVQRSGTDTGASWRFTRIGEGYRLTNLSTGQCAQPSAASVEDKAKMVQAACSSTLPEQQFKALDAPNGGTALLNVKSGKCVIVQGASIAEGATLVQYPCGSEFTNRLWTLTAKS